MEDERTVSSPRLLPPRGASLFFAECLSQDAAGGSVSASCRGWVDAEELCCFEDGEAVPVDEHDELALCVVEAEDRVSDGVGFGDIGRLVWLAVVKCAEALSESHSA